MGGKTQTVSTNNDLPDWLKTPYKTLISQAQTAQGSKPQTAGFTNQQNQAFSQTSANQGNWSPFTNAAQGLYQQGAQGVFPQVQQYNAQTLQQYQDPWQQSVIDATLANINKQNAVQLNQLKGSGIAAGVSPGLGDRMGLAAADLLGNQAAQTNQTIAGLESAGFQNAQSQLNNQQNLQLQGLTSDASRALTAGSNMASLGSMVSGLGYNDIAQLLAQGGTQQQYQQQLLDNASPREGINWLSSVLNGTAGATKVGTSTTTQPSGNLFSQLLGLGLAGASLFKKGGAVTEYDDPWSQNWWDWRRDDEDSDDGGRTGRVDAAERRDGGGDDWWSTMKDRMGSPLFQYGMDMAMGHTPDPWSLIPPRKDAGGWVSNFARRANNPLFYAGLAMAGGTSGDALQNIAGGGLSGLQAYQKEQLAEKELDAHPVVDDSGPTVRVYYPSEKRWEDTGIPSTSYQELQLKQQQAGLPDYQQWDPAKPIIDMKHPEKGVVQEGQPGYKPLITPDERAAYGIPPEDKRPAGLQDGKLVYPGSAGVTVNTGDVGGRDANLFKELAAPEAKQWSAIQEQGYKSAAIKQNMEMMLELAKQAPSGPILGKLAEQFPGFSNAGTAFNALQKQIAPTLRQPGSGSQSDIEYEGFLNSLPRLSNMTGGNEIIARTFIAKANIDMAKAQVINDALGGRLTPDQARQKLIELSQQSILTPEIRSIILQDSGEKPAPGKNGPKPPNFPGTDKEWEYADPSKWGVQ